MSKKTFKGLTTDNPAVVAEGQLTHLRLRLAHTLRTLREKEGLTQAAMAARLGLKQAAISKLESPYKAHDLETILRVLAVLDIEFVAALRDENGLRPLTPLRDEALVAVPLDIADDAAEHGLSLRDYICHAADRYRDGFAFNLKVSEKLSPKGISGMKSEVGIRTSLVPQHSPYASTQIRAVQA